VFLCCCYYGRDHVLNGRRKEREREKEKKEKLAAVCLKNKEPSRSRLAIKGHHLTTQYPWPPLSEAHDSTAGAAIKAVITWHQLLTRAKNEKKKKERICCCSC